jgi:serine kinase of HPr protein (carbohydrate metabolism regulator)
MTGTTLTAHGVFVAVDGLGIWLRGASGAGKSELGLELVTRGHRLVADDAIEFRIVDGHPHGRCPSLLEGFIEIRGLGILNLRRLYGDDAVATGAALDLIIDLGIRGDTTPEERLGGRRTHLEVLGVAVPQVSLARRVGHNLAVLVETAGLDHRLRLAGYDACGDLIERQASRLASARET